MVLHFEELRVAKVGNGSLCLQLRVLSFRYVLKLESVLEDATIFERKFAGGEMEVVEDMCGHVLSDGGLSETQISLKFVFPLLEGTAKRGQSIVNSFVDVLFSRFEMEESVSEPAQRIAPLQCSLVVFDFKACIERFLVVEF